MRKIVGSGHAHLRRGRARAGLPPSGRARPLPRTPTFPPPEASTLLSALMLSPPRPLFPGTGRPTCLVPALGEGVCSCLARNMGRLCPRFPLGGQAALTDLWSLILSRLLPQEGWKGRKEGKTRHQGPALGAQEALCPTGKSRAGQEEKVDVYTGLLEQRLACRLADYKLAGETPSPARI